MREKTIQQTFETLQLKKENNAGVCAGGQWMTETHADYLTSFDPTSAQVLSTISQCTKAGCEAVITKAHRSFLSWKMVPAPQRGELIRQISNALREHKAALATLISLEMGKIYQESLGEVQEMIDMADFAVGQSRMLYGNTMHSERPQHRLYEQWHPLGVVGIISAFNFPVAVWAWNAFLAVICGNTVIWKPSSKTPLCAIAVQHLCNAVMKTNKTPGIFSLTIFENKSVANVLLDSPDIPLISFTGSTPAGQIIYERVSKRLGKCLLELGGNNAVIVDESADLALATRALVFGAVGTTGQRCTTTRRLIIHNNRYAECLSHLKNAYSRIIIGDPLNKKTLVGPLIDAAALENHHHALKILAKQGAEIVTQSMAFKRGCCFVSPVIVKAENDWQIVQQETFSPILYVMTFKQFKDAVALQNHSQHGLSSALFTHSLKNAEYFLSAQGSDCGIANINIGTSGAEIGGAFGGEKNTGGGREAGSDAWKTYMRRQTNTINWGEQLPLAQRVEFG